MDAKYYLCHTHLMIRSATYIDHLHNRSIPDTHNRVSKTAPLVAVLLQEIVSPWLPNEYDQFLLKTTTLSADSLQQSGQDFACNS